MLAAGTGLRAGGVPRPARQRIVWTSCDVSVTVDQQLVTVVGREPFLAPPQDLCQRARGAAAPGRARRAGGWPPARPTVWCSLTSTAGRSAGPRSGRCGALLSRRLGRPTGPGCHDLRHFYASLLIRRGENVKVVQARLGHASAAETLDTYSHLWPDSDDRTRAAVDAVLLADSLRTLRVRE